jgi:hypothetical protein
MKVVLRDLIEPRLLGLAAQSRDFYAKRKPDTAQATPPNCANTGRRPPRRRRPPVHQLLRSWWTSTAVPFWFGSTNREVGRPRTTTWTTSALRTMALVHLVITGLGSDPHESDATESAVTKPTGASRIDDSYARTEARLEPATRWCLKRCPVATTSRVVAHF